eukprot:g22563.t1
MSGDERGPTRSGSFAAASAGGNPSGRADQAPRDRDPPPSYDGENPEVTFRQFEKQIALWEFETEIPKAKRGVKLLRQLSGTAATAVDDMEVADIATEHGVKNVMNKLRDYFMPHLEVSLPRAFEAAVYGPPRGSKESFGEYTKRMERAFAVLAKEGVDLPDGARGYILYRQASLNESQEQRLLTWAEGKYGRTEITVALRRMDKVLKEKDKSRSAYLNEETFILENAAGHHYEPEESGYQDWEDDDENYVFLADGDLDEVMDEQDVLSALAAYNDTRQALKDQRLNRGYFPGKGKGKINGFQKGKDKGKRRVHIEQLKLRTRCRRCLQIGHWEKECKNPPATEKGPERSFFVGLHPESQSFSDSQHQYWLRQFVKEKRAQEGEPASKSAAKSSEQYMERACTTAEGDVQFCGITTKAIEGVVDTAAEGGLIGLELLLRLERELSTRGLRIKWVPKQTTAKGVGGTAVVEGVALIPVGIGGINGVLETTVIQGDVPLLLPVRLLKALQVLIDLKSMNMHIPSHNVSVPLHELASGHVTVNVMSFASGVFCVPPEAVVMDKIGILLVLAALQDTTEAWCLDLASPRPGRKHMETIEDYYAEVILTAMPLKPLQSKATPSTSASACVHPKMNLKGGGNGSSSYIVCRACHSRWAHGERASDIHKKLKHGPLSGTSKKKETTSPRAPITTSPTPRTPMRSEGRMAELPLTPGSEPESITSVKQDLRTELDTHVQIMMQQLRNEQAANTIQLSQLNASQMQYLAEEVKRATVANREQEIRQEKLMQMLIQAQLTPECSNARAKRWARRAQRGEDPYYLIEEHYWVLQDGELVKRDGIIPKEETEVYVNFRPSRRTTFQDEWEEAKTTQLSRKNRQMIEKALKANQDKFKVTMAEVYSPPRISPLLEKMGLKVGPSYDLVTNWDLSDPHQRRAMWKSLREERPEVILACPPCTAFSRMQVINWGRMSTAKRVSMLQAGKEHLHLAIAVLKWQLRRGGGILFEHPDGATSWQEPELQALAAHHNIKTVVCDQCMFGLNVDGTGLNRKRTRWLSNMLPVIDELNLRCDGSHHHVHLDGGKPKLAQRYPDQLCQAVARGIVQYLKTKDITAWAMEEEQEEAQEEEEEVDPAQEEGPDDYEPTLEEKRAVMKVHRAVGHPQQREFVRFLRAARVRGEVVQWAAKKFTCDVCEAKRHPKAPRPTALPRAYQPNRVLGLDLFYVPAPGDGKQTTPILNILDWGTNYQMCEVIAGKNPNEVWDAYLSTWARTFGHPEVITCDAGREFLGEFIQRAAAEGIVVHQIASKAPWQQGKTERHGGHFKELLDKARSEVVVQNIKDLKQLMTEVEQAKNRYSNRSGFAPIQRQIGQWPRLPTSILSDEAIDPTLLQGVITDDIERLHHMRTVAHKAFCEYNAKDTMKRALRARPRIWVDYKPGEYVFVFRVPRLKKRKHGGITDDALATTKARWVGPGTVIAPDGANLWVSMMGELWKVAREQCRPATNDEKTGIEAVVQECQELIEEFKRGSHRAGYKDITAEEFPPEGEPAGAEENADFENPAVRQQRTRFQDHIDMDEYSPEYPDEEEPPRDPPEGHPGLPKRRRSVAEPEQEEAPPSKGGSEDEDLEAKHHPGFPEGVPETPPLPSRPLELPPVNALDPGVQEALRRSEVEANRLDGVPGPRTGPIYRWQQRAGRHDDLGPYFETAEWYLEEDDEWQEGQDQARRHRLRALQEERRDRDHWSLDLTKGELVRHHVKKRKAHFDPKFSSEMPIPVNLLSEKRQTHVRREGQEGVKEDQWTNPETKAEENWWKGKTVFHIKNLKETVHYLAEKKGQDEVNIAKETPQDQEEWKLSDLSEWNKVTQSGAVQVLGLEESQRVRRELKEQGQEDRILPTKIARRYKPGEQPGEPAVKKSRLCIRGDLDPDILDLERFSPTLNTVNFQVLLQIAANENMEATVGDLKNAFCQSRPLDRPKGKLYFQQPKEGVVGLHPDQIVMIIAGCYGLVDAPLHWRKSLTDDLKELGYEMSALDPCIMKLYDSTRKKLLGAIAIEVDDLFTVGHDEHHKKMEQLKKKYTFGKYVRLRHESDGCAFNGRRIRQRKDGGFLVDMQKFIQERLHPVPLEKGRKTDKKAMANDDEVSAARATCGALNWLSREGRPDASGPSSLLSSKLSKLCIEDINQMNQVVTELKANSELSLQIQPLRKMRLSVVTDASFANHGFHSQGGHLVLAHESHLRDGASVDTNILAWRSGKLQRVVNSTLAAETQSMSRGLAELLWIMVMVQELQDGKFNIKAWRSRLKGEELLVMASELDKGKLKESLAVVDAKSLFDLLSKDTIGGQDKRTAIEIQIIRQDLRELGGEVKWVDHLAMPADGLTKVLGSNVALYELIRSGRFSIRPTEEQMKRRAEARKAGASASRSKKSKKSVVSLRARGGEEDTRVCIPLEETESWYPLCKCRLMRVGWFNLPAAQHQKPRLRVGEASSTSEFPNVHENHLPSQSHWLLHPTQKVLAWGESARQELRNTDVEKVGGKSASLGEMISQLSDVGVPVPGGFSTTAFAYKEFLDKGGINEFINDKLSDESIYEDVDKLMKVGKEIRDKIMDTPFQEDFEEELKAQWQRVSGGDEKFTFAVRSSATAEDLPDASFAGQQETFLNPFLCITNMAHFQDMKEKVHLVFASLFTDRAISYRHDRGFEHEKVQLCATCQKMVRSETGSAGVMFSLDTESGFKDVVFVTSAYGLGETVVGGTVNPDEWYVFKPTLAEGKNSIISRTMGSKLCKMIYKAGGGSETVDTSDEEQNSWSASDEEVKALAEMAVKIEKHYGRPMDHLGDIEWARDGDDGKLYIVQARPETVASQKKVGVIEEYKMLEKGGEKIAEGRAVGKRIGSGEVNILTSIDQMSEFSEGEVLVADMTDPDWEPIMPHGAHRALGIPAIVGCGDATDRVSKGDKVTVSCAEGDTGYIYKGELKFEKKLRIMMNVGNPETAFAFGQLPNEGIGLARLEFVINNAIGVHPKALLNYDTLDGETKELDFYVKKIAEGVATLAASVYPKRIIVRLSDFKSNEYKSLIGGEQYEPDEERTNWNQHGWNPLLLMPKASELQENPMIGFRGCGRYTDPFFEECFAMELEAVKMVRGEMGLKNVEIMILGELGSKPEIPFVRTLDMAKDVNEVLEKNGLKRGEDGLKVNMMAELPSNVFLAEEFLEYFDGFSIGSNDLTQLTLGLDRDSGLVAQYFDERNPAVMKGLETLIKAAKKKGKYVGICGQGLSDHPDLAKWLMEQGIDSVSLNPDSVIPTWQFLAKK